MVTSFKQQELTEHEKNETEHSKKGHNSVRPSALAMPPKSSTSTGAYSNHAELQDGGGELMPLLDNYV